MTFTDLLQRCCDTPADHLADTTIDQFGAYEFGYQCRVDLTPQSFDYDEFVATVMADYHLAAPIPQNSHIRNFLTAAEGPHGGLLKYLDYNRRLAKPYDGPPPTRAKIDLIDFLQSEAFRKRPAMYLGNDRSAAHAWSMLSGAAWAERDHPELGSRTLDFMRDFQAWMEERYPFSRGIPWHRSIHLIVLHSADRSLASFHELLDLFLSGAPADSPSATALLILQNIGDCENQSAAELEEIVKKIAPI
jgi:hypothetical protein